MSKEKQNASNQSPSLEDITNRIMNDAFKPIEVPKPTPAGKPTPGPGFTSKGNPEKRDYEPLPEGYIPLLPLRFALSDEAILGTRNKDNQYPSPPEVGDHEGYVITRIRRGYVYIYYPDETESGKKWEVFRYETGRDDANGRENRDDTDERPIAPAYSFSKYDINSVKDDKWLFGTTSVGTATIPVRANQKRLYIAYSEFRWPYIYFNELEQDEGLCLDHMTPVVHDAPDDGQQRSFSELYDLSEYLYDSPFDVEGWKANHEQLDANEYAFKGLGPNKLININDIRYTQILPEYVPKAFWGAAFNDERARLVVLTDPVADQLDLNVYSVFLAKWLEVFIGIRHYPLVTGQFIKGIKEEKIRVANNLDENGKEIESGFWGGFSIFMKESLSLDDELTPDFEPLYQSLTSRIAEEESAVGFVLYNSKKQLESESGYKSLVSICNQYAYVNFNNSKYESDYVAQLADYQTRLFSRVFEGVANSNVGNQYLDALLNKTVPKRADGTPQEFYELLEDSLVLGDYIKILKIGEGLSGAISGGFN